MNVLLAQAPSTLKTNVSLAEFSTMRIGGTAAYACTVRRKNQLTNAIQWCKQQALPFIIIGEGSNTVWKDSHWHGCIIQLIHDESDIEIIDEPNNQRTVFFPAGISWDAAVEWSCDESLHGIEMLSAIPGTVGAAVVQNIGAYGSEIKDVFMQCEVFDTKTLQWKTLERDDCDFDYRSSIFKHQDWGRYVIWNTTLALTKTSLAPIPQYKGVAEALKTAGIITPKPDDIRTVITNIRWSKLPKPSVTPNCGSYFENAFTTKTHVEELLKTYPDMPYFQTDGDLAKIPSGWLIEQTGWKGEQPHGIGPSADHALVITNVSEASSFTELERITNQIQTDVFEQFGIRLKREVQWFPQD